MSTNNDTNMNALAVAFAESSKKIESGINQSSVKDKQNVNGSSKKDKNKKNGSKAKMEGTSLSAKLLEAPAKHIAYNAKTQRVSRRLLIAKHNEMMTCVCDVTGIVSLLNIPLIPLASGGKNQIILTWNSPLSEVDNCRGIAQAGDSYLRLLDTQTLAGILIVLADSYSLFRYQPSDSGAQKNAILRTAGKDVIINTILIIEDWINSASVISVPKLSMIMDTIVEEGGIAARITEWLRIVVEILYKKAEDRVQGEDEFHNAKLVKVGKPEYISKQKAAQNKDKKAQKSKDFAKTQAIWKAQREFKADKKVAKDLINKFASEAGITPKLKGVLVSIFTEDTLLTLDAMTKTSFVIKLVTEYPENDNAAKIITLIDKDRSLISAAYDLDLDDTDIEDKAAEGTDADCEDITNDIESDDFEIDSDDLEDDDLEDDNYSEDEDHGSECICQACIFSDMDAMSSDSDSIIESDTSIDSSGDSIVEDIDLVEAKAKIEDPMELIVGGITYIISKGDYDKLSFIERIKLRKQLTLDSTSTDNSDGNNSDGNNSDNNNNSNQNE
jgi:hypothetical protein